MKKGDFWAPNRLTPFSVFRVPTIGLHLDQMYLTEYLPSLSQLSVVAEISDGEKRISAIGIKDNNLIIQAGQTYAVTLPQNLDLQDAKVSGLRCIGGVLRVQIAVRKPGKSHFNFMESATEPLWSVLDLKRKTPQNSERINEFQFTCASCGKIIIESANTRFMDMPSEFWHEMMDFWHCHKPHEAHHNHTDKNYNTTLYPKAGQVNVGDTYLLINAKEPPCNCGLQLGEVVGDSCVKLWKWRLVLTHGQTQEYYPAHAYVHASILSKINSSGTRNIRIENKASTGAINAWVTNLGLLVTVGDRQLSDCMKILYNESARRESDELLTVPDDVFMAFSREILSINLALPQEERQVKVEDGVVSDVSFLAPA